MSTELVITLTILILAIAMGVQNWTLHLQRKTIDILSKRIDLTNEAIRSIMEIQDFDRKAIKDLGRDLNQLLYDALKDVK